jgi:hypothetical protein
MARQVPRDERDGGPYTTPNTAAGKWAGGEPSLLPHIIARKGSDGSPRHREPDRLEMLKSARKTCNLFALYVVHRIEVC